MSVVSDPEILKRLKQAEEGALSNPASSSSGIVVDANLKDRLDKLSTQQIENTVQNTEEATVSSVPEGSVFGDFFRTVASVGSSPTWFASCEQWDHRQGQGRGIAQQQG